MITQHHRKQIIICIENDWKRRQFQTKLTNYFNGLFVVEFFVPVEHPKERKRGEEDEAYSKEHVACETGKINPLWDEEQ